MDRGREREGKDEERGREGKDGRNQERSGIEGSRLHKGRGERGEREWGCRMTHALAVSACMGREEREREMKKGARQGRDLHAGEEEERGENQGEAREGPMLQRREGG